MENFTGFTSGTYSDGLVLAAYKITELSLFYFSLTGRFLRSSWMQNFWNHIAKFGSKAEIC